MLQDSSGRYTLGWGQGWHQSPPPRLLLSGAKSFLHKIEVETKKNKKWHKKEDPQPKKWCSSHKCFYVLFSITPSFLLGLSWHETLIILQPAARETHARAYQCIWDNYIKFSQKYYSFTTLLIWVVYRYICV